MMRRPVTAMVILMLLVAGCGDGSTTPAPGVSDQPITTDTAAAPAATPSGNDEYAEARAYMVDVHIEGRDISDPAVLAAMRAVPRHRFVPEDLVGNAYDDRPLPIGYGQTISQPFIVALMSEALGVVAGDRVLEIGTGSGYQAAILGEMDLEVYTVEIIPELAEGAAALLADLGYDNITVRHADGYYGWEEVAPFDAIIVTAAPDHVPQPLVQQLAPGAAMVIPVGPIGAVQTLWRFTVDASGELVGENLGAVSFVPFTRAGS